MSPFCWIVAALVCCFCLAVEQAGAEAFLLKPARVFDGVESHEGWSVLVRGQKIEAAGPSVPVPADAFSISSQKTTTRGASAPSRTDCRNALTLAPPPTSVNASPPRHTVRPGACSMTWRFRSQSWSWSSPRFDSDIATTCSAGNAANPSNASTARSSSSAAGAWSTCSNRSSRPTSTQTRSSPG